MTIFALNFAILDMIESTLFFLAHVSANAKLEEGKQALAYVRDGKAKGEVVALTFDHIQQRERRWVVLDLVGKGNRRRTAPLPS